MRRILYWLGLVDIVWTFDSTGSSRRVLRIVWRDEQGNRFVHRIITDWQDMVKLLPDGQVENGRYVGGWQPYGVKLNKHKLTWRRPSKVERVKHRLTTGEVLQ